MEQLNDLVRLAMRATPDGWTTNDRGGVIAVDDQANDGFVICATSGRDKFHNAEFIAAADPKTIIAIAEAFQGLEMQRDALAAENAALARYFSDSAGAVEHWNSWADADDKLASSPETPSTDAHLNSVRAEGIHFAANRILAAWDAGFIDDTPAQVYDITGAVLSALEFLADASPGEFKRDFADEIRSGIAAQLRAGEPS